jgi:hypothetical protein
MLMLMLRSLFVTEAIASLGWNSATCEVVELTGPHDLVTEGRGCIGTSESCALSACEIELNVKIRASSGRYELDPIGFGRRSLRPIYRMDNHRGECGKGPYAYMFYFKGHWLVGNSLFR